MKLVRFCENSGTLRPGIWLNTPEGEKILDVSRLAFDIHDYDQHFFATNGLARLRLLLEEPRLPLIPATEVMLTSPIPTPSKIIAVGANYVAHAKEFGIELPSAPLFFAKAPSAMNGPFDPIRVPASATSIDSEVELGVIIGRRCQKATVANALSYVAGYTIVNDVSDREVQRSFSQWFLAKSYDTFCPVGPFLVTTDEIPDPQKLELYSKLNGEILQQDNTANMIFSVATLIAALSQRITLEPGDLISTGTPSGIGSSHKPPRTMKAGDVVELGIEKIGRQLAKVEADG